MFNGSLSSTLQLLIRERGSLNTKADLPDSVMNYIDQFEKITDGKKKPEQPEIQKNGNGVYRLDRIDGNIL